jgi:outer membrane protein
MALLLPAAPAASQGIAFVDFDRILAESEVGKQHKSELDAEAARYTRDLDRMQAEAKTLQDELARNSVTMSAAERSRKERELNALSTRFQQKKTEYSEDFEHNRKLALDAMVERIRRNVERIAKADKLDVVVNRAVAVGSGADITLKVIRAMDDEAKKK